MNTTTKNELAEVAGTEVNALAILTLDPATYVAEVFKPYRNKLATLKAEAELLHFQDDQLLDEPHQFVDVSTTAGMETAIKYRAAFRDDVRIAGEKARVDRKAPILMIGKLLDSEYKALASEVAPLELRFDQAIKDEEARKEAIKQAKLKAERDRMAAHEALIIDIQAVPLSYVGATAAELVDALEKHRADPTLARDFEEYAAKAQAAQADTFQRLTEMHAKAFEAEKAAAEAEAARKAEAERIEAERKELAALREAAAESARLQAIEHGRIAAEQAAERQRIADLAAAQEAEAARLRAATEANLAAERAALDEQMRVGRERLAAEQAAANAELAAARDKLNKEQAAHAARVDAENQAAQAEADRIAQVQAQAEADEAERVRLQGLADQHQVDAHASPILAALCDAAADIDEALRDDEIIELVAATFGMSTLEAIDRLAAIDFAAARLSTPLPGGQYYSKTTFRDDGKPILCNADGTRSIFCDLDE